MSSADRACVTLVLSPQPQDAEETCQHPDHPGWNATLSACELGSIAAEAPFGLAPHLHASPLSPARGLRLRTPASPNLLCPSIVGGSTLIGRLLSKAMLAFCGPMFLRAKANESLSFQLSSLTLYCTHAWVFILKTFPDVSWVLPSYSFEIWLNHLCLNFIALLFSSPSLNNSRSSSCFFTSTSINASKNKPLKVESQFYKGEKYLPLQFNHAMNHTVHQMHHIRIGWNTDARRINFRVDTACI